MCVEVRGVVTRWRRPPSPLLSLVGGAYNGEWLLWMIVESREAGPRSHKVHPGKLKSVSCMNIFFQIKWELKKKYYWLKARIISFCGSHLHA